MVSDSNGCGVRSEGGGGGGAKKMGSSEGVTGLECVDVVGSTEHTLPLASNIFCYTPLFWTPAI